MPPQNLSNLPVEVNLRLYAGDSFALDLAVTDSGGQPRDVSAATARSHIRATPEGPLAGEFECSTDGNLVRLVLLPEISAILPARGVWDVDLTETNGWVTTLAAGTVTMTAEVTRIGIGETITVVHHYEPA